RRRDPYPPGKAHSPKELTLYMPRTHPDDIIGRETDLSRLYDLLRVEKRVVVVNGLGGSYMNS
ncbi:MAG TPA: hypothetical protein VHC48_00820, partial [Puia sp.]|nr:hypothetical protein [Puia sp.]